MNPPILFDNAKDCCACGACMNICPHQAIVMNSDEAGFAYPIINPSLCVGCKMCKTVCDYQDDILSKNLPVKVYAAQSQNTDLLKSASGGVFASLASDFIAQNGVAYGVVLESDNGINACIYKKASAFKELEALCGSKYVHANTSYIYTEIKNTLEKDERVLFSGTPCQVAGLKSFLKKEYDNLFTIDIICHGVPEERWFIDYINYIENKYGITVDNLVFRDKKHGWGRFTGRLDYTNAKGKKKKKFIISRDSSYYYYFLTCSSFRENCYSCKYATHKRIGDLTIGDYWGIEKEHPDEISSLDFDLSLGVSCIMVNTEKGDRLLSCCGHNLKRFESKYENVYRNNEQLQHPSTPGEDRKKIIKMYKESGYGSIDTAFKKKMRGKALLYRFYSIIRGRKA